MADWWLSSQYMPPTKCEEEPQPGPSQPVQGISPQLPTSWPNPQPSPPHRQPRWDQFRPWQQPLESPEPPPSRAESNGTSGSPTSQETPGSPWPSPWPTPCSPSDLKVLTAPQLPFPALCPEGHQYLTLQEVGDLSTAEYIRIHDSLSPENQILIQVIRGGLRHLRGELQKMKSVPTARALQAILGRVETRFAICLGNPQHPQKYRAKM
ncbi:alpha carbonic anhydrase 8-like [Toxotes jaculatrix]|uniref:alpha carbonic anhydrase 8-like n=1 Tax=Toxotes jaculatrix TaxID=941984 RepID=UPI001B3AA9B1|nr:alpha carbonic anhydrase 8-like [Toxotes jaculatrix]